MSELGTRLCAIYGGFEEAEDVRDVQGLEGG